MDRKRRTHLGRLMTIVTAIALIALFVTPALGATALEQTADAATAVEEVPEVVEPETTPDETVEVEVTEPEPVPEPEPQVGIDDTKEADLKTDEIVIEERSEGAAKAALKKTPVTKDLVPTLQNGAAANSIIKILDNKNNDTGNDPQIACRPFKIRGEGFGSTTPVYYRVLAINPTDPTGIVIGPTAIAVTAGTFTTDFISPPLILQGFNVGPDGKYHLEVQVDTDGDQDFGQPDLATKNLKILDCSDTSTITITKFVDADVGDSFNFTTDFDLVGDDDPDTDEGSTDLTTGSSSTSVPLQHGIYTITENLTQEQKSEGWYLVGANCGTPNQSGAVTVDLSADDIECTFTNAWDEPEPSADLQIVKTDSPDPVVLGQNLTYTLQVTNNGPDPVVNAAVFDTLPASVIFVSVTPGSNDAICGYDPDIREVTCEFGYMGAGDVKTATIVVTPTVLGQVSNTATVDCTTSYYGIRVGHTENGDYYRLCPPDPNEANDSSTATTQVIADEPPPPPTPYADLSVVKTDSADPVTLGENLTYTLAVTNSGPNAASGLTITDQLPSSTTFVSVSSAAPGVTCAPNAEGTFITCHLGTLAVGQTIEITIVVLPTEAGMISNTATVSSPTSDPDPSDNTDTEGTDVVEPPPPGKGLIVVQKQTRPDGSDETFDFTGELDATLSDGEFATIEVDPGTYFVFELEKSGWSLNAIRCTDSDATGTASAGVVGTGTATLNVEAEETVTCVFTNVRDEVLPKPPIDREEPPTDDVEGRRVTRPETLPFTGSEPMTLTGVAAGIILLGLIFVAVQRRSRAKKTI